MIQGYGYIRDSDDNNPGAQGSRARIDGAARLIREGKIKREGLQVFFPQRYSKERAWDQNTRMSLGEMLARYCSTLPEFQGAAISAGPRSYGTVADIREVFKLVRESGFDGADVFLVSDPAHIRRVELIWNRLVPRRGIWHAKCFGVPEHQMPWKERWIKEPIKWLVTFVKLWC